MEHYSCYDEMTIIKKMEEVLIDLLGQTLIEIIPLGMSVLI